MQYNQPLDQPSQPNASYIDGNPAAGINGSIVPAASIEFDQREIIEVITRANARGYVDFTGTPCAAPANADLTQLRKAIEGFISSFQLIIDTTITFHVHGSGADFPDLNAAMAYLRKYYITPNGHVILQLAGAQPGASAAVQYIYNQTIYFSHANNNRISVFGAKMLAAAPVSYTGYQLTGPSPTQRPADTAVNLAMLRTKFATELHFTNVASSGTLGSVSGTTATPPPQSVFGPTAVFVGNACPSLLHFDGLLLTGDGAPIQGLVFQASFGFMNLDTAYGVACVGFGGQGFTLELGASIGQEGPGNSETTLSPWIAIGNGGAGIGLGDGSYLTMSGNLLAFSNGSSGMLIWPRSGVQMDGGVHAIANAGCGVQMLLAPTCWIYGPQSAGTAYTQSAFWKNGQYGFWAAHSSAIAYCDCGAGGNANALGSIWAGNGSVVEGDAGDVNISASCSPPWGVIGNNNSMIV